MLHHSSRRKHAEEEEVVEDAVFYCHDLFVLILDTTIITIMGVVMGWKVTLLSPSSLLYYL
jgi:hypothetical protein